MKKGREAVDNTRTSEQVHKQRRERGLCMYCGRPAIKSTDRGMDVNLRLAAGRGLASEYHTVTKGKWKPGDPPPTLKYLTHEGLCRHCKQRHSKTSSQLQVRLRERAAKEQRRKEREHDVYAKRLREGLCGRCGKQPQSTTATTKECNDCIKAKRAKALASPYADNVIKWLKAGESQYSIRNKRGMKRHVIEPLAAILRNSGELPAKKRANRRPAESDGTAGSPADSKKRTDNTSPNPAARTATAADTGPTAHAAPISKPANYRANIDSILRRVREGQSQKEIGEAFGVSVSTIYRWVKHARKSAL